MLEEKGFEKVNLKGTESIEILDFVDVGRVSPIHFYKPYYIEPMKGGAGAYALLREVLADTRKIGIAKVVIRNRQHLAAVKANGPLLVLELMHFASEITPAENVKVPAEASAIDKRALDMARMLVEQMSSEWKPERYTDEYATAMMALIEKKVEAGGKELPAGTKHHVPVATNVIDLVAVLQKSLSETGGGKAGHIVERGRLKTRAPAAAKRAGSKTATKKRGSHRHAA